MTGVGHREGIGFAIARRLLEDGVKVMVHSLTTDDAVLAELGGGPTRSPRSAPTSAIVTLRTW